MKTTCFLVVLLFSVVSPFAVQTIQDFPTSMIGGSTYTAHYQFNNGLQAPFFIYINISNTNCSDVSLVPNCSCDLGAYICNFTSHTGTNNIYLSLTTVPNIMPGNYDISTQFSTTYFKPKSSSHSSSYAGSVYVPVIELMNETPEVIEEPIPPVEQDCWVDSDCSDSQACFVGNCRELLGDCGYASGHAWYNYKCCADSQCLPSYSCQEHECVYVDTDEPLWYNHTDEIVEPEPPIVLDEPEFDYRPYAICGSMIALLILVLLGYWAYRRYKEGTPIEGNEGMETAKP